MSGRRLNHQRVMGMVLMITLWLAAAATPFVGNPQTFGNMVGMGIVFVVVVWGAVQTLGYLTNPKRKAPRMPPDDEES